VRKHPCGGQSPRGFVFPLVLAAAGLVAAVPVQAQETFTLEDVLSAPFPSGLVSSPGAGLVAWVQNDRGERNVWVARAPDFAARRITDFRGDDGQEIGSLVVVPDGGAVVFVRGGAPNRQGEVPNPLSTAEWPERELWIAPLTGDGVRRITTGSGPAVSPAGDRIAFLRRGGIWEVGLEEGATPRRLATVRGQPSGLAWSPDGRLLAFVSRRGDHSFVGVLDPGSAGVRYLDPALSRDRDPVWSPDGTRIAFLRIANERQILPFAPRREGLPWSIRVVEVSSGRAWTAWTAPPGPGSVFRGISARTQLFWAAGDRLVFPWEGDGWTHLYAVPASGGEARLLTPGKFEVQYVSLSANGRDVLYSSNQDDIDRQHLWSVAVSGGPPRPLTPGTGIEWSPVPADTEGSVAFLGSGARMPAQAHLLPPDGRRRPLAPGTLPERFPADRLVVPEQVVFSAADGMRIHGQLFLPRDLRPGERRPAVIFFHGGSRRQMLLGFHHRGYYHNAYAFNQYLASRGYIVLSVNYRSGIGYGMEFREALNYGARGASEFNDVLGAGLYLRSRPDVDPDRIGLWGGSYGGYLTALGLARASDLFAAGVDLHGVHDWNVVIRNFVPSYDAAAREAFARLAFESSPMASIDTWRSPVLLIHGDDDRNVPFSESVNLAESLRRRGVEFEELVFPDEVHGFLLHRSWLAAYRAAADFFDRHLKGR